MAENVRYKKSMQMEMEMEIYLFNYTFVIHRQINEFLLVLLVNACLFAIELMTT